jgi:hypothetical protein
MGFREDVARRIEKKRAEIDGLEVELLAARAYLQALEDMHKIAARESPAASAPLFIGDRNRAAPSFRAGSMTGAAYEAIKSAGRPLHVNVLLSAIGRAVTRQERSAVSGTLAAYVRKGEVFTRPAPNTFGLVELGDQDTATAEPTPPLGFGKL